MGNPNQMPAYEPQGGTWKIPVLFGSVIALLGANIFLFTKLDTANTDFAEFKKSTLADMASLKESSSVSVATARRSLSSLKDELEAARRQQSMAVGQAKLEATKHTEEVAKKLSDEQARQAKNAQQMKQEINQVGEVATTANTKLGEVTTEVGNVKTDVQKNKSDLEKTIADLKSVRGDLGEQSGLVATNGKELMALKALGERNYFEFNLTKTKEPRKVGDVSILLKRVDTKKNKYTIEVLADDKRVEKKDKSVNEPIQFYMAKARQPYEIVVNEIKKDQIVGYLATPKVQATRN